VIAGVFGYRAMQHKPDAPDAAAGKADAAPVAPVEPVKLGSIAFTPCSLSAPMSRTSLEAQCATFEVPEDRANPAGRKIALNVAWLQPGDGGEKLPDPVFFLAGGPGQAAVASYPQLDPVFKEVRKRRSVILVDQRGTGKSNLLACGGDDDAATDISPSAMRAQAAQCVETLSEKADLRHYTTTDAIADLDDVRKAIGAAQINLVGVSYGT